MILDEFRKLLGHIEGLRDLDLCEAKQLSGYKVISSSNATACTRHAFIAFGIDAPCAISGVNAQAVFKENGFTTKIVGWLDPLNITVRRLTLTYPSGNYYLTTDGHGMALRGRHYGILQMVVLISVKLLLPLR